MRAQPRGHEPQRQRRPQVVEGVLPLAAQHGRYVARERRLERGDVRRRAGWPGTRGPTSWAEGLAARRRPRPAPRQVALDVRVDQRGLLGVPEALRRRRSNTRLETCRVARTAAAQAPALASAVGSAARARRGAEHADDRCRHRRRSSSISLGVDRAERGQPADRAPAQRRVDLDPGVGGPVDQPALEQHRVGGGRGQAAASARARPPGSGSEARPVSQAAATCATASTTSSGREVAGDQRGAGVQPSTALDDRRRCRSRGQVAGDEPEELRRPRARRSGPGRRRVLHRTARVSSSGIEARSPVDGGPRLLVEPEPGEGLAAAVGHHDRGVRRAAPARRRGRPGRLSIAGQRLVVRRDR